MQGSKQEWGGIDKPRPSGGALILTHSSARRLSASDSSTWMCLMAASSLRIRSSLRRSSAASLSARTRDGASSRGLSSSDWRRAISVSSERI